MYRKEPGTLPFLPVHAGWEWAYKKNGQRALDRPSITITSTKGLILISIYVGMLPMQKSVVALLRHWWCPYNSMGY